MTMKRLILSIGLLLLVSFLVACGDLAGDVEIVGQLSTSAPQSTNLTIPNTAPESANSSTAPEATAASPEMTPDIHSGVTGSITGHLIQGTAGGIIPVGSIVRLQVIDMLGTESSFDATVNTDGTYLFPNIFVLDSSAYRVSIDYSGAIFSSEFVVGTAASPNMILDTLIYETTDDPSVLQINMVLSQIDMISENSLQVWQMITVSNLSDRVYIRQNAIGQNISVAVPVPMGFNLSTENDLARFTYDTINGIIYDSRPVLPFVEHNFHLIYTVPFTGSFIVNQRFDYPFSGPYEVYADASLLSLSGNSWRDSGTQTVAGITYAGIGLIEGSATGQNLQFTINRNFQMSRAVLAYGLILLGLVFIIGASLLYWRNRVKSANPTIGNSEEAELMKTIADLDERFEAKQISKKAYERERKALKARLVALIKAKS